MASQILWFSLLASICFSGVLCRNSFYEQYFSRYHHKGHSTTEGLESSTKDVTPEGENLSSVTGDITPKQTASSTDDDYKVENLKHSTTDDRETSVISNATFLHYGDPSNDQFEYVIGIRIAMIGGSILFIALVFCCLVCCCRKCYRGTERRGFIISNPGERATEVQPQPVLAHHPQQPLVFQHYPPQLPEERMQLFVPQGHPQAMQQHYPPPQAPLQQPPSALQFHNPPEAPPPYDFPSK